MTHAEVGSTALWLMLLLGAYHGINPGMGWLFAVRTLQSWLMIYSGCTIDP